jgi:signal transduction histidine kinase
MADLTAITGILMNFIFIPNAIVLILLGVYTWRQNPGRLSAAYFITNLFIAVWALCFLLLHEFQTDIKVNPISQLQLISALLFANGFYEISVRYPDPSRVPRTSLRRLNELVVLVFAGLILFSDYVSRAVLEEGEVVFIDGTGYLLYSVYLVLIGTLTIVNLVRSYRRYPAYRVRVGYMLSGLGLFIIIAIIFDLILVLMGNYDLIVVGHLGSLLPSLFFAYAFSKHDLLDIRLLVQRNTARVIVASLLLTSLYLAFQLADTSPFASLALISLLSLFWVFNATKLEVLLVSTARRRFVRSWYDPEEIIGRLAERLDLEKNREDIFRCLVQEMDQTFELERAHCIVARRDPEDRLISYRLLAGDGESLIEELACDDIFIQSCMHRSGATALSEFDPLIQQRFSELGYQQLEQSLAVTFFSPEHLEGVLILGERSNQEIFSKQDQQFLSRLDRYVAAILYRLTPFEKLERLYFENQRRLHEAEIQLVRGEKTRAIAHATRQAHHEIRTPLNIIRMAVRRIKDRDTVEKYRLIIEEQIDRAMEIVDETLAITDIDSGDMERYEPVALNPILLRCLKLLPEGGHSRELDLATELPPVNGIARELQVLFTNLIKNALESMLEPGVLRIKSGVDAGEVMVSISDTGIGIEPELREKIWEPYFSGKVTSVGNITAGRGWGLTISSRIVLEHKGTITFTSTPGKGTTFTVRFPALTYASPAASVDPALPAAREESPLP